jgi:hypothetical protein
VQSLRVRLRPFERIDELFSNGSATQLRLVESFEQPNLDLFGALALLLVCIDLGQHPLQAVGHERLGSLGTAKSMTRAKGQHRTKPSHEHQRSNADPNFLTSFHLAKLLMLRVPTRTPDPIHAAARALCGAACLDEKV